MKFLKVTLISACFILLLLSPFASLAEDDLSLSATVAPKTTDAEISISASPLDITLLPQNTVVTYTITYRSNVESSSFPFHLKTSWTKGKIPDSTSYILDSLDYVTGSAKASDDGTVPVVDIANRQITWDIPALAPSSAFHTVSYQLKVHDPISTDKLVEAITTISAQLLTTDMIPHTIQTNILAVPSPTTFTTPPPQPTVVISPKPPDFQFTNVNFTQITDSNVTFLFTTNEPSKYSLVYGTSKDSMTEIISDSAYHSRHAVSFSELEPNTRYFFRIRTTNKDDKTITSDIFTFVTAKINESLDINSSSLAIYINGTRLSSDNYRNIVLPNSGVLTLELHIPRSVTLKKLSAQFVGKDVLGTSTENNQSKDEQMFVETLPGVLTARLPLPTFLGAYQLVFNAQTTNGTYITQIAPYTFHVSSPITVINIKSKAPVEVAHLQIYRYEESSKRYIPISESIDYKDITDYAGHILVALPSGKYKFEAWAVGYPQVTVVVDLGITHFSYPKIELSPAFNIPTIIAVYLQAIQDNVGKFTVHLKNFANSTESLKASYLGLALLELLFVLLYKLNQKRNVGKKSSELSWLLEGIYMHIFFLLLLLTAAASILFSFFHQFSASIPFLFLLAVNIVLVHQIVSQSWKEYKN